MGTNGIVAYALDDPPVTWHRRPEVEKGDVAMEPNAVPTALRERLGVEGTNGLVQLLETARGSGRLTW